MRTRRGDEPTSIKVTSKREAYKPNVENQKKISEYESAISKSKLSDETYSKQMKYYNELPKGEKELSTLFPSGGRYLNPKEIEVWNKEKSSERAGLMAKKVMVSKGYGSNGVSDSYSGYKGAFHEWIDEPQKEKSSIIERPKLVAERMPLNKITSIKSGGRTLSEPGVYEKPEMPKVGRVEEKFYTKGGNIKENKAISRTIENIKRKAEYSKEMRQGKAYFGGFEGETIGDISERKKVIKQDIKDVLSTRPIKGMSLVKEGLSKLKQAKQAERYVKKVNAEYTGVVKGQKSHSGSKVRFVSPETFKGYKKK